MNLLQLAGKARRTLALLVYCLLAVASGVRADTPIFYYYHSDHLGSTSVVTDTQGLQVDHYQYTAYGRTRSSAPAGLPLTNRFTSQAYDDGSGLYYYNARYYDPELGNFIQPDTVVPESGDPQSLDRYCYVRNNPLNKIDPTGHGDTSAANSIIANRLALLAAEEPLNTDAENIAAHQALADGQRSAAVFGDSANAIVELNPVVALTETATGQTAGTMRPMGTADRLLVGASVIPADKVAATIFKPLAKLLHVGETAITTGQKLENLGAKFGSSSLAGGGTQILLEGSEQLAEHHIFPQTYRDWFASKGIAIDQFTVTVDHFTTHLKAIHGKGNMGQMPGRWNKQWASFIAENPQATAKEVYEFGGKLMDEFGINNLPIHPYSQ